MLALLAFLLGNTKNILIIAVGVASCLTRDGRGMNAAPPVPPGGRSAGTRHQTNVCAPSQAEAASPVPSGERSGYKMDGGNGFHRCPNGARRGGDGNKWILRSAKVDVDDISKNIQIQAKERTIHSKQAY